MIIAKPDRDGIAVAARAIRDGKVVAYPTETVYGLAVDPFSREAIRALFEAKGRPEVNPVLLIAADVSQVEKISLAISDTARRYMERFWPGPLSLVLRKHPDLPSELCGGGETVCVRVPGSEIARDLCRAFGGAITSTSANRSGEPSATKPGEIKLAGVHLCIDAGALPPSAPSTVFDPDTGVIFRQGAVAEALLRANP